MAESDGGTDSGATWFGEAAELYDAACCCGGDGEPIFFGLFFGVIPRVLPSVDAGIACG